MLDEWIMQFEFKYDEVGTLKGWKEDVLDGKAYSEDPEPVEVCPCVVSSACVKAKEAGRIASTGSSFMRQRLGGEGTETGQDKAQK